MKLFLNAVVVLLLSSCASTQYFDAVSGKGWADGDILRPNTSKLISFQSGQCCKGYMVDAYLINNKRPTITGTDTVYSAFGDQNIIYRVMPMISHGSEKNRYSLDDAFYIAFKASIQNKDDFILHSNGEGEFYLQAKLGSEKINAKKFDKKDLYDAYSYVGGTLQGRDAYYVNPLAEKSTSTLAKNPEPIFAISPPIIFQAGEVSLSYDLNELGVPTNIAVISSPSEGLSVNAKYTLSSWRFQTTIIDGKSVGRRNLVWKMTYILR